MRGVHRSRMLMACVAACFAGLAGCSGAQSALDPAGPQAGHIGRLLTLYFFVSLAVYLPVLAILGYCLTKRRSRDSSPELESSPQPERRAMTAVAAAVVATIAALFALLLGDFITGRELQALEQPDPLAIKVTPHQWWWEFEYQDPTPSQMLMTANEIHVPTGRAIRFEMKSPDVIHSFWIPNLHGKTDVVPGYITVTSLRADRAGIFWGQCAEYCGHQHATMRFAVVAEPPEQFQQWLDHQRHEALPPNTDRERHGQHVFLSNTCVMCHAIAGTSARARTGPDLTHLAGRLKLASGTLPMTRGHLAGWIVDPQRIRPGVRMPMNSLSPDDLRDLLDYLETLK